MPNGKPGDHPLTDILTHGFSEYGESVNSLVKKIAKHPNFSSVRDQVGNILWELSPMGKDDEKKQELNNEAITKLEEVKKVLNS